MERRAHGGAGRRRWVWAVATGALVLMGAVLVTGMTTTGAGGPPGPAGASAPGPYFDAAFGVDQNAATFGQDPTFTADGRVLSQEDDSTGVQQIYRSTLGGSGMTCLTCGRVPGPNGFAAERPGGGWILFASYGDQPEHFGNPGFGGYGGDLYVVREDGSDPTRLTAATDPGGGASFDTPSGVPYDNYHPYWSPDGRHLAWVRTEAYPLSQGGQRWEILEADFVAPPGGRPHLADVRVVGPAYGVYETQQWAPDGSGFLFTAFGPAASPYQATPPGWMHQELYFMRLFGPGASPAHPLVTQLSDDLPVYQEQAAFTPDMRDVIFMSNRNAPQGSWYDAVIAAAMRTGFDAPYAGSVGAPQFLADFSDPNFRSDLYMEDVRTHDVRRLTDFPADVIPEFSWNAAYTQLLWTVTTVNGVAHPLTQVGTFTGLAGVAPAGSTPVPAPGLEGQPVDLARVAGDLAASTGAGMPASPVATTAPPAGDTLPPVVGSYAGLWLEQLAQLGDQAGAVFTHPPLT